MVNLLMLDGCNHLFENISVYKLVHHIHCVLDGGAILSLYLQCAHLCCIFTSHRIVACQVVVLRLHTIAICYNPRNVIIGFYITSQALAIAYDGTKLDRYTQPLSKDVSSEESIK